MLEADEVRTKLVENAVIRPGAYDAATVFRNMNQMLSPIYPEMDRRPEPELLRYAVWGTQGGGLVREVNGTYIFIEAPPTGMGLNIGDEMPDQWGVIPANEAARKVDMA